MLGTLDEGSVLVQADQIYDSALDGGLFDTILDQIASRVPGALVLLYGQDSIHIGGNFLLHRGLNAQALCAYMAGFAQQNRWFERQWTQMPGRVYQDSELLSREAFVETHFYRDWLSWQGDYECATGMVVHRSGTQQLTLEIRFAAENEEFLRPKVTKVLNSFAPHIVRGARIFHCRHRHPAGNQVAHDILEMLPFPIVLLDADCRVQTMNSSADALVRRMEAFFLGADGYLHAVDPQNDASLKSAVAELGTSSRRGSQIFTMNKTRGDGHYFASLLTLGNTGNGASTNNFDYFESQNQRIALIIQDCAEALRLSHDTLWRAFGLTSAEAELAGSLLQGTTIGEYATQRSLSKQTLRNQLSSIMRKTDTCRQSQLVALLTRLAVSSVH